MANFLKSYWTTDLTDLTLDDFIRIRVEADANILKQTYDRFQRYQGCQVYPFFCWIADSKRAVLSLKIENDKGTFSGSGLFTEDEGLVKSLEQTFDYYRDRAMAEDKISPRITAN